jgi:hypothetical protein
MTDSEVIQRIERLEATVRKFLELSRGNLSTGEVDRLIRQLTATPKATTQKEAEDPAYETLDTGD